VAAPARGIRAALHSIAIIENPAEIKQVLAPRDGCAEAAPPTFRPFARAPP
jgi:hypothetical protein